jgi:CBS domain containing-hemolysin-like protein
MLGLAGALVLWTALTGAETTLAQARRIGTPAGARRLGRLHYELHRHPRRLLISLALARELALTVAMVTGVALGWSARGLAGGLVALAAAVVLVPALRGLAAGAAARYAAARPRVAGETAIGPALAWLLAPLRGLAGVVKWLGRRVAHAFLGEPPSGENLFAPEELAVLEETGSEFAAAERTLVANAVSFGERTVHHVLTPRRDIISVPVDIAPEELMRVIRASGCSRLPVFRGDRDEVVGILYVKDLLGTPLVSGGIERLLRQPYVVAADKPVAELLREFRSRKVHIALVVDEYGSLVGLVTMEDLLEELFGEIRDEFDDDAEPVIERRGPSTFVVSGRVSVADFNARLKLSIPPSDDEATIAGVVLDRFGRVPAAGERLTLGGCTLTVERLDGSAIELLRVDL